MKHGMEKKWIESNRKNVIKQFVKEFNEIFIEAL